MGCANDYRFDYDIAQINVYMFFSASLFHLLMYHVLSWAFTLIFAHRTKHLYLLAVDKKKFDGFVYQMTDFEASIKKHMFVLISQFHNVFQMIYAIHCFCFCCCCW